MNAMTTLSEIVADEQAVRAFERATFLNPSGCGRPFERILAETATTIESMTPAQLERWKSRQDEQLTEQGPGYLAPAARERARKIIVCGETTRLGRVLAQSGASADAKLFWWVNQFSRPPTKEQIG
jgi:hypothetical protein